MSRRQWWERPELRTDEEFDHERPVGWLELFFDLVFVVVIARLAHHLGAHLDARGVLEFVLAFVGVFWVWNAFIYYTERLESEGLENRLVTFLAIPPLPAPTAPSSGTPRTWTGYPPRPGQADSGYCSGADERKEAEVHGCATPTTFRRAPSGRPPSSAAFPTPSLI